MIITKTPFRISFSGGGSDLPSFYREHGGCVLSTSINKYMYISIHPYFDENAIMLKYSKCELVRNIDDIKHPILKSVLEQNNLTGVEITSTADIPSGTGLGSSSSFTVGLHNTVGCYKGKYMSKAKLAELACFTEIDKLCSPIGKQDQYAAAFGGINFIKFNRNDTVTVEPLIMSVDTYQKLQSNLLMFYTGDVRSANTILEEQNANMKKPDKVSCLLEMCNLTYSMREALQNNDLSNFGEIMHKNWLLKRRLSNGISNELIDEYYERAINNGALGGKLLGAGGGGFLLFYCEKKDQPRLRNALPLKELKFAFDSDGSSVIFVGDKYWSNISFA